MIAILLGILVSLPQARACTTIELKNEESFVSATNADFVPGLRKAIFINRRGIKKEAVPFGTTGPQVQWVSKYGSLSSTFYGREFPLGGINEAGLTVHMQQGLSTFEKQPTKPQIHIRQTVQYVLDTSATIDEAVENLRKVSIHKNSLSIHWWICESTGACAAIDARDGQIRVFRDTGLPISALTNTPYDDSLKIYDKCLKDGCTKDLSKLPNDSNGRFIKASYLLSQFNGKDLIKGAFDILDVARQTEGLVTLWQVAYRQSLKENKREVFFYPSKGSDQQWINMADLDFSCKSPAVYQPIMEDSGAGNIASRFLAYDKAFNTDIVLAMVDARLIPAADADAMIAYPDNHSNCN